MAESIWSQDVFSKGELSPLMYSRTTTQAYYNGVKVATNCIGYPQGGIGKRFGTIYQNSIANVTDYNNMTFDAFQYLNECVYLVVITAGSIFIYLEGTLVATVNNSIAATEILGLDITVIDSHFRVASEAFRPQDLVRGPDSANVIVSASSTLVTLTTSLDASLVNTVLPIRFTTSGALPTSTPQIRLDKTYFAFVHNITTISVYSTAPLAKAKLNAYIFSDSGTGTNNVFIQNTWVFGPVIFQNVPVHEFDSNYYGCTFTLGSTTGLAVTLTVVPGATGFIFTSAFIGGSYAGFGGISRIVGYSSATVMTVDILVPFDSAGPLSGREVSLTEPAWSDKLGWPAKCSSFQSRAIFANSSSLANGIWLSVINDYDNFNDIEGTDDDDAISWYPSSDNVNYIRYIVPYRSLTVHTNTGVFSTPLSFETAITPTNFSMTLQDSTPATAIQPRGIDNQIVIISGNDVHAMLWDGFNNSYTSTIASVANEHLIDSPHDEAAFVDQARAGSRYVFIINDDGSMVIFQTLISENVQGFTPASLEQSYGNAYFRWTTASPDGRAWFVNERWLGVASTPVPITAFTSDILTAVSSNFSTTEVTQCTFTTSGSLPTTDPQIVTGTHYWAIGLTSDTFSFYVSKSDAESKSNAITISALGSDSDVVPWPLTQNFFIEELSFDTFVDCATIYNTGPSYGVNDQGRFNGQEVVINADGFGLSDEVSDSIVSFISHGEPILVTDAQIGFPIHMEIVPMPVAPPGQLGYKGTSLPFPQHVRIANFMFTDTIGGYINDTPIALTTLTENDPGIPPIPRTGIFQMTLMGGWNPPRDNNISITHSDPFEIKLTGIWYKIEG